MAKKIIFQDSFLVSGIMCHQGCGLTIENYLAQLDDLIKDQLLPEDAKLIIDSEPQALGVHKLFIIIETDQHTFQQDGEQREQLSQKLKTSLSDIGFEVISDALKPTEEKNSKTNWINILINLGTMIGLIALYFIFPASLPLTIACMAFSFATTAFTARSYLINFYRNLRSKSLFNMATPVSLGWLLSFIHSIYHAVMMPMVTSFSMAFMNFMMPVMLITIINAMDEIKRWVLTKSKNMHLSGLKNLFPQMAESYPCQTLSQEQQSELEQLLSCANPDQESNHIEHILQTVPLISHPKNTLQKNTIITVKAGECFPVDGVLVQGSTLIDSSILTGETQQHRQTGDFVPAGAINLAKEVKLYARENSYHSAVNKLLFRSNRAQANQKTRPSHKIFGYLYTGLILASLATALVAPFFFGILTLSLALQNITGILFAICPCTITIAHQLPQLLSVYSRNKKGIVLRHEQLTESSKEVQTLIFDKTGTLTTGNSQVAASEGITSALWQRIYLLEKQYGAEHPLAKAICTHYEALSSTEIMIDDIKQVNKDAKNRGLTARVQGKTIHIGSEDFMNRCHIALPGQLSPAIQRQIEQGFTLIYVAEDHKFQGIILVKHEIRKEVLSSLKQLKQQGKRLIMLTGDSHMAAHGFNQQNGSIFEAENIHAQQTPTDKETFLSKSLAQEAVWFVGDGLNDAPCARLVTEQGGLSFAMNSNDKAAFFTDISLNGSLTYLKQHNQLNQFIKKNTRQNQGLTIYSTLMFLTLLITFSVVGIALSPLIPLAIMLSTTLFTLFNSYRVKLAVDVALENKPSWIKTLLASDASIGLLVSASTLFMISVLITTLATGGLALPVIVFTAGIAASIASVCILAAAVLFASFALLSIACLIHRTVEPTECNKAVISKPGLSNSLDKQSPIPEQHSNLFAPAPLSDMPNPKPGAYDAFKSYTSPFCRGFKDASK